MLRFQVIGLRRSSTPLQSGISAARQRLSAAEGADPLTPLVSGNSGVVVHGRAVGQIQAQVGWEKIGLRSESPPSAGRFQINLASLASPISVSSKRRSCTGASFGGSVSAYPLG